MEDISKAPARFIEETLWRITLPALFRPQVPPDADPTMELVFWGMRKYAYSLIAHFRMILRGITKLADEGNEAACIILCRHIYEWNMQTSYAYCNFEQHLRNGNLRGAWELFLVLSDGNTWINQHGSEYAPELPNEQIDPSVRLKHFVKAYKAHRIREYGSETVDDDYSYLSEHSHPNGACLNWYMELHPPAEVRFVERRSHRIPGILHACVIEWTLTMTRYLGLSEEQKISKELSAMLQKLAAASKRDKSR